MRRACPNLLRRHLTAKNSTTTSLGPDEILPFAALKTPWSSAAQLRRHLLSDPTSKSRDKFVGIVESLFKHSAFSLSDISLTGTFEKLVLKVAFVFKNVLAGDVQCAASASASLSSDSSVSLRGKTKSKKRRFSTRGDSDPEDDREDDEVCCDPVAETNGSQASTLDIAEPPRKLRYVTRSSTDGFRPSTAVHREAPLQCRYRADRRAVRQHMPLIRPDMHPVGVTSHRVGPLDPYFSRDEDDPGRAVECVFDSALFDDHHIGTDLDCEQWDFLDDWAWQHNAGPTVITYTTLNSPRPSHPLPLHGAGFTLQGQPVTNASQHALSSFRSIAHTTVPSFDDLGRALESPSPALWPEQHNAHAHGPPLRSPSDASPASAFPISAPFPDNCAPSIYARRTTFYRPVTPEPPFRQLASTVVEVAAPVSVSENTFDRAPLSDSVLSGTSENTTWSDSDALSSCMTLDSQYVRAMGQLNVEEVGCEQGQTTVPCSVSTDDVIMDSDNLW